MKKVFVSFVILVILAVLTVIAVWQYYRIPNVENVGYSLRLQFTNVASQVALSLFTLAAVGTSLWYSGLNKIFLGPCVRLETVNDDLHCVLINDPHAVVRPSGEPRLNIYVHAENTSNMPAEICQISCNCIFASIDGNRYYRFRSVQAASFKWSYPEDGTPYKTSVYNSVEKYSRIVQIVQQSSEAENGGADVSEESLSCGASDSQNVVSFIRVCIPSVSGGVPYIDVPSNYKSVLIPLTVVYKKAQAKRQYLRIVWKGDYVALFRNVGFLEVAVLSERKAKKMIEEEC